MTTTPKSMRLHIGLFGRRNTGKSSLLNAVTRQNVAIVSSVAGTTTDPVEKPMELLPLGPVVFIDTAGVDDEGALGRMRVARTEKVLDRTDVAVLVVAEAGWGAFEEQLLHAFTTRRIPAIVAFNKADVAPPNAALRERLRERNIETVATVAPAGEGIADLREAFVRAAPDDILNAPPLLADLLPPGGLAVLVVPVDMEAPKGRLILPQAQAIRDLLDHNAACMVVQDTGLAAALDALKAPPALVVTDSQAFRQVAAVTPPDVPLTSFSILFARARGDLAVLAQGAAAVDRLEPGDRILVCEACTHHPIGDDIGRVKIPAWLNKHVGGELAFQHTQGHDFPADLSPYRMVIHCGSCMLNRKTMLTRIARCQHAGVAITNYGLTIAYTMGIFERALGPFPAARNAFRA